MAKFTLDTQAKMIREYWNQMNVFFEEYAKRVGLSYSSLIVLTIIYSGQERCTQKLICEKTGLPKQTVNSIITGFYKAGIVELHELPEDRRNKVVVLTASGSIFATDAIQRIQKAELAAMKGLDVKQRAAMVEGVKHYKDAFQRGLE